MVLCKPKLSWKRVMNDRVYAQITVRLEFARLLKALFETEDYEYVELPDRGLFLLSNSAAYLGEISPIQDFLASHGIAYDLAWSEGQNFDSGVRQVRFSGPKAEVTEKWIFPWDEACSSDQLQPLCSIPLTDRQRRLALQTPIKADRAGIVDKVLVTCGQPVEYNQMLFLLR